MFVRIINSKSEATNKKTKMIMMMMTNEKIVVVNEMGQQTFEKPAPKKVAWKQSKEREKCSLLT